MILKPYLWTHSLYCCGKPQVEFAFSLDDATSIALFRVELHGLPRRGLLVREMTQTAGFA